MLKGNGTVEQQRKVLKFRRTTHSQVVVIDSPVDLPPWVFHIVIISIFIDFLGFLYCLQKSNFPSEWQIMLTPNPVQASSLCHQPPGKKIMPGKLRYHDCKDRRFCGLMPFRGSLHGSEYHRLYAVFWLNTVSWQSQVLEFVCPFPKQYPLFSLMERGKNCILFWTCDNTSSH